MKTTRTLTQDIVSTGQMILWEYGNQLVTEGQRKEKISLLFLARTMRQLLAIESLVDAQYTSDGCILYRSLLERYLLFVHLCGNCEFEVFDDWCFKRQYESENTIKSIREFSTKPEMRKRKFSDEQKARYATVCADPRVNQWRRPDMEAVARTLGMKFLYDAGYDWGSSYVHPVSTDGEDDYFQLMGRGGDTESDTAPMLVRNARLISVMHIQRFLNEPEYDWRRVLYDLIDAFVRISAQEVCDYQEMLKKVEYLHGSGVGLLSEAGGERSGDADELPVKGDD